MKKVSDLKDTKNKNFVYLYKSLKGLPIYVGYGKSVQRALTHSGGSHNKGLKAWLAQNQFDLSIAGPYASRANQMSLRQHGDNAANLTLACRFQKSLFLNLLANRRIDPTLTALY